MRFDARQRTVRSPRRSARLLLVLTAAWLSGAVTPAFASTYLYADPSGFATLNSGTSTNFALGGLSVTANRLSSFSGTNGLTLGSEVINFPSTSPSNPAWVAGVRDMFRLRFSSNGGTTRDGSVDVEYVFSTALPTSAFLVFADFDVKETLKIRAYDAADTLIGFGSLAFARQNGRQTGGDSLTLPTWTSAVGYSGVIAYGNNTSFSGDDPVVTVASTVPIARLVYESDNDPYDTVTNNDLYFNFALLSEPVPEIDPAGLASVTALIAGCLGLLERRRSRRG